MQSSSLLVMQSSSQDLVRGSPQQLVQNSPQQFLQNSPLQLVQGSPQQFMQGFPQQFLEQSPQLVNSLLTLQLMKQQLLQQHAQRQQPPNNLNLFTLPSPHLKSPQSLSSTPLPISDDSEISSHSSFSSLGCTPIPPSPELLKPSPIPHSRPAVARELLPSQPVIRLPSRTLIRLPTASSLGRGLY
jgi:hypothetical protein